MIFLKIQNHNKYLDFNFVRIILHSYLGSQRDNSDWEYAAKTYLNSFDHEYSWFSNPENEAEARINASTLKELKKSQIQIVEELIRLNSNLIFSIADILMGKDEMETEQCFDVLKDVTLMPAAT